MTIRMRTVALFCIMSLPLCAGRSGKKTNKTRVVVKNTLTNSSQKKITTAVTITTPQPQTAHNRYATRSKTKNQTAAPTHSHSPITIDLGTWPTQDACTVMQLMHKNAIKTIKNNTQLGNDIKKEQKEKQNYAYGQQLADFLNKRLPEKLALFDAAVANGQEVIDSESEDSIFIDTILK